MEKAHHKHVDIGPAVTMRSLDFSYFLIQLFVACHPKKFQQTG